MNGRVRAFLSAKRDDARDLARTMPEAFGRPTRQPPQRQPPREKAKRCRCCGRWVKPDILVMCQAWWLCYHCGGAAPNFLTVNIPPKDQA